MKIMASRLFFYCKNNKKYEIKHNRSGITKWIKCNSTFQPTMGTPNNKNVQCFTEKKHLFNYILM